MKNYGINWELEKAQQSEDDYIFGGLSQPCIADIPESEREKYLPQGERQNIGEEKMWCATAGSLNILETKFTYLVRNWKLKEENIEWLYNNGYIVLD